MRALVLSFVLFLPGCAAGVGVTRNVAAARYDLGDVCSVRLVMTGTASGAELVSVRLKREVQARLVLQFVERADAEATLEVHVERWGNDLPGRTEHGEVTTQHSEHMQAIFRLTRADGAELLTKEYFASSKDAPQQTSVTSTEAADALAAGVALGIVTQFMDDVVPETTTERLAFVQDADLQPGIALVAQGDIEGAERSWRALDSAGARYDLGALLESRGQVQEALVQFEAAAARSPEPRYQRAVEVVRRSLALRRGCLALERTAPGVAPR